MLSILGRSSHEFCDRVSRREVLRVGALAASKRAEEMFVRYAFRFFLGRNETLRDAATLRQAHAAYVDSHGSMKTLVVSLLSSDSFLYRSTEP